MVATTEMVEEADVSLLNLLLRKAIMRTTTHLLLCGALMLISMGTVRAQNIYHGGTADGFTVISFSQSDNPLFNIYSGGNDDGFSNASFAQTDNVLFNIYQGGTQDGFAVFSFAQSDNVLFNIYQGGNEDGFAFLSFAQADNILFDIYKGGNDDGFTFGSFAQIANPLYDIYSGGTDDGFSFASFAQATNVLYDIYHGGINDGYALNCFAQADNPAYDIYKGGIADGFSFSRVGAIGGEVALPIVLVLFDGRYKDHQIVLVWKTASEVNNDHFELERSRTGRDFTLLFKVAGAGTSTEARSYAYADEAPFEGVNYYRLKQVDFDGKSTFAPNIVSVYAEPLTKPVMHIIPNPSNPTNDVRVQLDGLGTNLDVELTITNTVGERVGTFRGATDANSSVWLPNSLTSGMSAGVYIISVQHATGKLVSRWVVK